MIFSIDMDQYLFNVFELSSTKQPITHYNNIMFVNA